MSDRKKWIMPEWMEEYCGGVNVIPYEKEYVEEMYNDNSNIQINGPRVLIACTIRGMVHALARAKEQGVLIDV